MCLPQPFCNTRTRGLLRYTYLFCISLKMFFAAFTRIRCISLRSKTHTSTENSQLPGRLMHLLDASMSTHRKTFKWCTSSTRTTHIWNMNTWRRQFYFENPIAAICQAVLLVSAATFSFKTRKMCCAIHTGLQRWRILEANPSTVPNSL